MQTNQQPDNKSDSVVTWKLIAVLGAIGVGFLLCLALAIVIVVNDPPALPTAAAAATVDITAVSQPADGHAIPPRTPTITPIPETPAAPQAGGQSIGDPYAPELGNTGYDVQAYDLQLALDPAVQTVVGTATIQALSTLHGLSEISLDFAGFQIETVLVDGLVVDFRREGEKLIVSMPDWLPAGTPFSLNVSYQGRPVTEQSPYVAFTTHLGLHFAFPESLYAIAEPDGARYWFPANDHPRDKARFRFEITVPQGLTAVANGELVATQASNLPDGRLGELFIWEHDFPMAPYLALVAVGPYERLDDVSPAGIPLRHYVFPESRAQMLAAVGVTGRAIDWMSGLFGPYPFEAYGHVTARVQGASMETQTMVLLSDAMIGERTIVHEMAHMWFGDWVSLNSWSEMWRNEGFATYIQIMWETADDPEALALQMEAVKASVRENGRSYPLNDPPPVSLFDFNIYFEGAVVVHELRQEMGDEAFFSGLRTYMSRYGGATASDAQFKNVMEEAAGISLDDFFARWFPPG